VSNKYQLSELVADFISKNCGSNPRLMVAGAAPVNDPHLIISSLSGPNPPSLLL